MTTPKPRASSDTSRSAPDPTTTRVRDELIAKIKAQIAAGGWTQQKAAELSGLTQPRISDLLRGNTSRFSLDALVSISAALERHSSTTEGGTMEYTEADGRHLVAEFMARLAARPVKGRYPAATENPTTERGGNLIPTHPFSTLPGRHRNLDHRAGRQAHRYKRLFHHRRPCRDGGGHRALRRWQRGPHRLRCRCGCPLRGAPAGLGGQRAGQR